jgi:hypothetical protein
MLTGRLEEQLGVVASADTSCSVLWLLSDDPAEFGGQVRQRQICAAFVPSPPAASAGWVQASPAVIDQVAARFDDATPADPLQVQRSRHLGGRW